MTTEIFTFIVCNEKLNYNYGFAEVWVQYHHSICKKMLIPNTKAPSQCASWQYRDTSLHKAYTTCPESLFLWSNSRKKFNKIVFTFPNTCECTHVKGYIENVSERGIKMLDFITERNEMGTCLPSKDCNIKSLDQIHQQRSTWSFDFLKDDIFSCWGVGKRACCKMGWQRTQQITLQRLVFQETKAVARHVSVVCSTTATMLVPWPVFCPLAGNTSSGHHAARPPKPLTGLVTPAPEFLQGATCLCFIQICLIFNLLPNEQMWSWFDSQIYIVRTGCRARNFSHFVSKSSYRAKSCFYEKSWPLQSPRNQEFRKWLQLPCKKLMFYRIIFILQNNILNTLMDRDICCQARRWFDGQGS